MTLKMRSDRPHWTQFLPTRSLFGSRLNAALLLAASLVTPLSAQQQRPEYDGVLLDFSATWCGPCRQVAPIVEQMERQGLPVKKIDVDQQRQLANQFQVSGIPCFVLVVNGQEVQRLSGYQSEATLRSLVARIPLKQSAQAPPDQPPSSRPEQNRTAPPQFPGHATPQQENRQQLQVREEPKTKDRFPIPFVKKTSPKAADPKIQARAKVDELKLPKLDRPRPMASSTRICVTNRKNGSNLGSGTIISSEIGQTYIITCGHVFRDFDPETSVIEVDFFTDLKDRPVTFVGKLVKSDLKADVGLISIPTDTPLPVSPVAKSDFELRPRDSVLSIGCAGGEIPTEQQLAVTRINRYSGPHNIECTGVPEQGRSGGGLFSPDGLVIGVCTAADKQDQRGIYAGYRAIHRLLDEADLSHLYRGDVPPEQQYAENTDRPARQRSGRDTAKISSDATSETEIPRSLLALKNSLGELGNEEVVVRIRGANPGDPRRMVILRDSALTSRQGANSGNESDESGENR